MICLCGSAAAHADDLEKKLVQAAHDVEYAVLPMMYWGEHGRHPEDARVVGTGFLINEQGYFVTAAHVLSLYEPNSSQLTATIRQKDGNGGGRWFDVVEKDERRDLALCKIKGYTPHPPKSFVRDHPDADTPFASLRVAGGLVRTGQFVALAGFPLGAWNPAIQFGTVAATETVNPNAGRVGAGQRELIQVAIAGNKGNSGSPVISLDTEQVVAVIVQALPAPLYAPGDSLLPVGQSSGIMLAVPSSWILDLLSRNHVSSSAHHPQ